MSCALRSGCGWCGERNECDPGTSTGPTSGSCRDWAYTTNVCMPADPCTQNLTCGGCTAELACGWCADDGRCRTGDRSGPTSGACSRWAFVSSGC
jgi:hypothetical protein